MRGKYRALRNWKRGHDNSKRFYATSVYELEQKDLFLCNELFRIGIEMRFNYDIWSQ